MVRVSYRTSSGIYGPKDTPFPTGVGVGVGVSGTKTLADLEMQLRRSKRRELTLKKFISVLLVVVALCMSGLIAGLVATCENEAAIEKLKDDFFSNESEKIAPTLLAPTQPGQKNRNDVIFHTEQETDLLAISSTLVTSESGGEFTTELTDITSAQTEFQSHAEEIEATTAPEIPNQTPHDDVTFNLTAQITTPTIASADLHFSSTLGDVARYVTTPEFQETTSSLLEEKQEELETSTTVAADLDKKNKKISNETNKLWNATDTRSLVDSTYSLTTVSDINDEAILSEKTTLQDISEGADILEINVDAEI